MATTATTGLKFFRVASLPESGAITGGIYFDKTHGELAVWNGTEWERYSGNVKNVVYDPVVDNKGVAVGGKLNITYFDGNSVELDFTDVASKTQVATDIATALSDAKIYADKITVNGKQKTVDSQNITVGGADIALTGYTKPASTSAIAAGDSVNEAIGKLEKAIEATDGSALTKVNAGNGISVTDKGSGHEQTISVKIDAESEKLGSGESATPVLTASTAGLKISGIKTAIDTAINGLDVADSEIPNEYVSSVSETNGKIAVSRKGLPVIGIADNDKILSHSGAKIGATLSIKYDSASKKIYLYGKDDTDASKAISFIDCTDFIKDGMLFDQKVAKTTETSMSVTFPKGDSHTYENLTAGHTYIFLEFNDGLGKDNSKTFDALDATTLVDVYTAGGGLNLSNNKFSINLDSSKYLSITDNGNGKLHFNDTEIDETISAAIGNLDATKSNELTATEAGTDNSKQIKVTVSEVDGKLTGVTVNAPIFAKLSELNSAKSDLKSELIGTDDDTAESDTITGAKKYAAAQASTAEQNAKTYTDSGISTAIKGLASSAKQNESLANTSNTGIKAIVNQVAGELTTVEVSIADGTYAKPADITTEIGKLNATVSNDLAATGDGVSKQIKVTVKETAGKLESVTVNAPAFDLSGAASTAESNANNYTNRAIQTLDADKEQVASATEGLALHVVQTDGKIESVSGSMNWCAW